MSPDGVGSCIVFIGFDKALSVTFFGEMTQVGLFSF